MKEKKTIKVLGKTITSIARKVAEIDANTACPWIGYQPQLPKTANKLRKF